MSDLVFWRPQGAYVGDVIPFEENGTVRLFYLVDERTTPKPGMPWGLVQTDDYVHLEDQGIALASGGRGAKDFNCYTGSVLKGPDGTYHMFYTGNDPDTADDSGRSIQLVMHATSGDLRSWTRHDDLAFGPGRGYEPHDWRDPFVFRDDERGVWRMLIAARKDSGPDRRRGVTAQFISDDLFQWRETEPFWDPGRYVAMECPEVFHWNGWWYFVYSEFTDAFATRYRMARSLDGPWIVPEFDTVDGRAFYAAKGAFLDGSRYFTGWIATKEGEHDDGAWQWAGSMSTLQAEQEGDGTLAFHLPDALTASFAETVDVSVPRNELEARNGYACTVSDEPLPGRTYIRAVLDIAPDTRECGLLLRASADGDRHYQIRLEPHRSRMVFDRWPRKTTGGEQWQISGDVPYYVELERPCDLASGTHTLEIIMEGSAMVAVLDRKVAMSARMYDRTEGRIGVFVSDGSVTLTDLTVRKR